MRYITTRNIAAMVVMFLSSLSAGYAQQLMGLVTQRNDQGLEEALPGANVYWLGTSSGTVSGKNGMFMINRVPAVDKLVVSYTGFTSDTLIITDQSNVKIELRSIQQLKEVTVEGWKPTSGFDHARGINTVVMEEKE